MYAVLRVATSSRASGDVSCMPIRVKLGLFICVVETMKPEGVSVLRMLSSWLDDGAELMQTMFDLGPV